MEYNFGAFEGICLNPNDNDYNWGALQRIDAVEDPPFRSPLIPVNSRKRSSRVAGLGDNDGVADLLLDFDRKMRLTKAAKRHLKTADQAVKHPAFAPSIMKYLPESSLRAVAITCREWRNLALETRRKRKGNKSFSILWLDKDALRNSGEDMTVQFSFITYFHPSLLGPELKLRDQFQNCMDATDAIENGLEAIGVWSVEVECSKQKELKRVNLILTYGTGNMADFLSSTDAVQSSAMYPENCVGLYTLSSSVVVSSPDNSKLIEVFPGGLTDDRLLSSVMFPACSHLVFETFLVPSNSSNPATYPCVSEIVGIMDGTKTPKVLILYQYLSLADSEPGIVEVLQSLKTTVGSNGFPMVTGIYDGIHGKLSHCGDVAAAASGLLISGDGQCSTEIFVIDLLYPSESFDTTLTKMKRFYEINDCSCKHALLFYHNTLVTQEVGLFPFRSFLRSFHSQLSGVLIYGLGSLSGAHAMFVNADSASSWNELNLNMVKCATAESNRDAYRLIFVLLAYETN